MPPRFHLPHWFESSENRTLILPVVGFLFLLSAMIWLFPTSVTGLRFADAPQATFYIPHTFTPAAGSYTLEGILSIDFRATTRHLTLRADDCIEFVAVDGTPILDRTCAPCQICVPFVLEIPESFAIGAHQLSLRIRNLQGASSFDLRQAHGFGGMEAIFCLAVALGWLWIVRRRRMPMWNWWIVILATYLAVSYFLATDITTRQMDVEGHQEYVGYLLTHNALPRVDAGWETFQPPLYYILSAAWIKLGSLVAPLESWRWLQLFAMAAYLATVMLAVSIWNKFDFARSNRLGLALFVFLPAHVYLSARVNNDILMPLWGTLITFLAWEYAQHERMSTLLTLSLCLVFAMTTKFFGVALFAGAAGFIGWHAWRQGRTIAQIIERLSWIILPGALWILAWTLGNYAQTGSVLYSNYPFNANELRMANNLYRYFSFDLRAILTEPFFNTWGGPIRESWPTALVVSSLFGEYNLGFLGWSFLSLLIAMFLPLAALPVIGFLFKPRDTPARPWQLAIVLIAFQVLLLIIGQWSYTIAGSSDARYWASIYFPIALLSSWGYSICLDGTSGILRWLCRLIPMVFFALLAAFYFKLLVP